MFNPQLHSSKMADLLKSIYSDVHIRSTLGFKGGTAAMLFYQLPRYSVDLDFDMLNSKDEQLLYRYLPGILKNHGGLLDFRLKRYTLFGLVDYGTGERKIKIEISRRANGSKFELKSYLGIPMMVIVAEDMATNKLAALVTRKRQAMRDLFDAHFFLKNNWSINEPLLESQTKMKVIPTLQKAIEIVKKTPDNAILHGLGEMLDNKQKDWARAHLKEDLLFQLKKMAEMKTRFGTDTVQN